jgi:hypothetical protein
MRHVVWFSSRGYLFSVCSSVACLQCKTKVMYKAIVFVVIAIVGIASASKGQSYNIQHVKSALGNNKVTIDICPECIDVARESIQVLLDLILDTGILGSCQTLCQALAQKTGSQLAGVVCDFVCSAVGIIEFIKLIDKADLDPIWYCEIAKLCPGKKDPFLSSNCNSFFL